MANENTAGDLDRIWKLTRKVGFAMLVTSTRDLGSSRKVVL
jgi:hypothetical protein